MHNTRNKVDFNNQAESFNRHHKVSDKYRTHLQLKFMKPLTNKLSGIITLIIIAAFNFNFAFGKTIPISVIAAKNLTRRLIPKYQDQFVFEQIKSRKDVFQLKSFKNKILIQGNNANSMAVGLNYYLKYYCNSDISWYKEDTLYMPSILPMVNGTVIKSARVKYRFFLNYCTYGYTMPWWQWSDWQWFIDWMALNGINMPLAITGQEGVWENVWKKLGLNDEQIKEYFTGPAYLPWHRMANIDHWDGPLPQSWIDNQMQLQKKILHRERELNMTPILPAFAGHVPEALKINYPDAKISSLGDWGGFESKYHSYFLDSFDPLFNKIQKEYISEQSRLFGTNHIYGIDPFNEVTPPSWEPTYLSSASANIFKSLELADPKSQWMQMTWLFYFQRNHWTDTRIKSYLTGAPQNKMILLDYFCDNTELWKMTNKFYGQPYIWCYLGNFGGNTSLSGDLREVETRMENAFKNGGDNMWGVGSTLEGFDCNPMMYEYVFEKAWSTGSIDVDNWISNWASRRLGRKNDDVQKAWSILLNKVYITSAALRQTPINNARPSLKGQGNWTTNSNIKYNSKDLLEAWGLLVNIKESEIPKVYQFDVVNIGRQVLSNYFLALSNKFNDCYDRKDIQGLETTGRQMLDLMDDLNSLLATNDSFLLGKWLESAKKFGKNEIARRYFEGDAKRIITTWGNAGQSLNDYANRSWAGLTETYYKPRWKMFIDDVIASAQNKDFNEKRFKSQVELFEWNWTKSNEIYSSQTVGNSIQVSKKLYKKYATALQSSHD